MKKKAKAILGKLPEAGLIFKGCNMWNLRHKLNQETKLKPIKCKRMKSGKKNNTNLENFAKQKKQ